MQSTFKITMMVTALLLAAACGRDKDVSAPLARQDAPEGPPASATKPTRQSNLPVPTKEQARSVFGPVVATKSNAGNCNGIVLGRTSLLLPSHCVEGTSVTFPRHGDVETVKMERLDSVVAGVEALIIVTIRVPTEVPVTAIDAAKVARPEALPSAYKLSLVYDFGGTPRELPCFVVTYSPGAAVGYHCQTNPGHSGSLLLTKDGTPLAVHLGRRDGLGYGLLLATVLSRPTSNPSISGELK